MSQEVKVKFTGDSSNLKATTAQVRASVDAVTKRVQAQKAAMAELRGSVAALAGAYVGIAAIKGTLDFAGRVQDLSDRLGESAEEMQRLGAAAKPTGADLELIAKSIGRITVNAVEARDGNEDMAASFKALGIDAAAFVNLPLTEKLVLLAQVFSGAQGDGEKLAQVMTLLGKSGVDLLPLLKQGPDALREAMASAVVMTDVEIAKLDDLGDRLAIAGTTLQSTFGSALVWVTDRIEETQAVLMSLFDNITSMPQKMSQILDRLKNGDFAGAGQVMTQSLESRTIALMNKRAEREKSLAAAAAARAQPGGSVVEQGEIGNAGGGSTETSGSGAAPAVDPTKTSAEGAVEAYKNDPANYRNGRLKSPGVLRQLERTAAIDRARADRNNSRGIGGKGTQNPNNRPDANDLAQASGFYGGEANGSGNGIGQPGSPNRPTANDAAQAAGFYQNDPSERAKRQAAAAAMADARNGQNAADGKKPGEPDAGKSDPAATLGEIKKILDDRLPKKTT